jgi:hypothetical protein
MRANLSHYRHSKDSSIPRLVFSLNSKVLVRSFDTYEPSSPWGASLELILKRARRIYPLIALASLYISHRHSMIATVSEECDGLQV